MSFLFLFPKMTQSYLTTEQTTYQQLKPPLALLFIYTDTNICIKILIYYNYWLYLYKFKRLNIYLCH